MVISPKFRSSSLVVGLFVALLVPAADAAEASSSTKAQRYRKPVANESIQAGCARIDASANVETVRKVVSDFDHYSSFIRRYKNGKLQLQLTAHTVGRTGDKRDVYLEVPILKGTAKVWGLLRFDAMKSVNGEDVLEGKLVKGNVQRLDARWRIRKIDDTKTAVHLELLIVPKVPVPSDLITGELEFVSDVAVTGTRDEAERLTPK